MIFLTKKFQVIEAPTAPMTTSHLEQERKTQNEYAQEVLRQIQSFGEAADDEFDVQWAASMTAKKVCFELNRSFLKLKCCMNLKISLKIIDFLLIYSF